MNKSEQEKVCAVVVTFNRKDLLIECLDALQQQTRSVDAIYIIDNASTDTTPELLKQYGYIQTLPSSDISAHWETHTRYKQAPITATDGGSADGKGTDVYYVRMCENTGGAGGFHEGVKRGYEKGFDWLWLMDDDVESGEKALTEMLAYKSLSKCIHPSKTVLNNEVFYWDGYFDIETMNRSDLFDSNFQSEKNYTFVNVGCFEGMLIHRDIISKIGYPDKRFFIGYDDTIYGLKASRHTNVLFTRKQLMNKKIGSKRPNETFYYYHLRNLFLVKIILDEDYPTQKRRRKYFFIIQVLIMIRGTFIHLGFFEAIKVVKSGMLDGINKKFFKKGCGVIPL